MAMNEATTGIIVGVVVALAGQMIAYISDQIKNRRKEKRRARAVITLLRHEVEYHRATYEHHLLWVQESIEKGGEEHTEYSYEGAKTDAYDKVFLTDWHLLPDEVLKPVMEYYGTVHTFNLLGGDFTTPTPVPIIEAKKAMERAKKGADGLVKLLDKHIC
jgi:hypothetical protein